MKADRTHIIESLALLAEPGQVIELRVPNLRGRTASGYFNDVDALAAAAAKVQAPAIYVTLNPVNPALLARAANRLVEYAKTTTTDADITRLRWLPVDLDPVRPSGISSTDAEHDAALTLARRIRDDLRELGWPEPIFADSGNGAHLLYRIDLAPTEAGLVQQVLVALADSYDTDAVKIDRGVHNPARIWKLYGTPAAKGDSTPDRPHRLSCILEYDELDDTTLTVDQLAAMAALAPPIETTAATDSGGFDLEAFIERHADLLQPRRVGAAQKWRITCAWNPAHAGDAVVGRMPNGAIWAKCSHNSCNWNWHDLRAKLEPEPELIFDHKPTSPTKAQQAPTKGQKLSARLFLEVVDRLDLFVDQVGEPYARVEVGTALTTMRIGAGQFGQYLSAVGMKQLGAMPSAEALAEVRRLLAFHAAANRRDVFLRVGEHDGRIYLDMGTPDWKCIEIDADGWQVLDRSPIPFRRSPNTAPLPMPVAGGRDTLRKFVNVEDDDWPLVASWLVSTFRPTGPYPVLALVSSAGSAKSTTTSVLKQVIDPAGATLRSQPKDIRDLMVAAKHSWVMAFDNVSWLNQDISDALCRLATGGGYTTRLLYSDDEEAIFVAQRPIVMNGIADAIQAADLMDRAIIVSTPELSERRSESAFWREFRRQHPIILGEFLDAASTALRNLPTVQLAELPRMADFAEWATAAAPALGGYDILERYTETRTEAMNTLFEGSRLAQILEDMVGFDGTTTELLAHVDAVVDEQTRKQKWWPKDATRLGSAVRRLVPVLQARGVLVQWESSRRNGRRIQITKGK